MKIKKFIIVLLLFILLPNTYSFSQNIAYANLDIIVKNSNVGKKIIAHFTEKNNQILEEYKANEKKFKEQENQLISQKNILEKEEYSKKVQILTNEIKKFNKENNEKLSKINSDKEKISKSFLKEINSILKDFAEKNDIDIIISSKQMLIGKSNLDVTDKLLQNVNDKIKKFDIN